MNPGLSLNMSLSRDVNETVPEKIAEEEREEFKKRQRRRSSIAVPQINRRVSSVSAESFCKSLVVTRCTIIRLGRTFFQF